VLDTSLSSPLAGWELRAEVQCKKGWSRVCESTGELPSNKSTLVACAFVPRGDLIRRQSTVDSRQSPGQPPGGDQLSRCPTRQSHCCVLCRSSLVPASTVTCRFPITQHTVAVRNTDSALPSLPLTLLSNPLVNRPQLQLSGQSEIPRPYSRAIFGTACDLASTDISRALGRLVADTE